jgi:adenine nucleotide transporter 17
MEFKTELIIFYRKYGIIGLYKGMEAKLLQTILTAALMFAAYEKIANFVFRLLLNQRKISSKLH